MEISVWTGPWAAGTSFPSEGGASSCAPPPVSRLVQLSKQSETCQRWARVGTKVGSESGGGEAVSPLSWDTPLTIISQHRHSSHIYVCLLSPFQVINFNGAIHLITATWENKIMAGLSRHIHRLLLESESRKYGKEPWRSVQKRIRRNTEDGRQA